MSLPLNQENTPIFVTGCPRSGTTWIGRMLASHPRVCHYHEPFNPDSPYHFDLPFRFYQPTAGAGDLAYSQVKRLMRLSTFSGRSWDLLTSLPELAQWGFKSLQKKTIEPIRHSRYRPFIKSPAIWFSGKRILFKDPTALFAADWLAKQFQFKVVILVRHPAAVVSSLINCQKCLGWNFALQDCFQQKGLQACYLEQPELSDDIPYESDLAKYIFQWKLFTLATLRLAKAHSDWMVVRYEDLCRDPDQYFIPMCQYLKIDWTNKFSQTITKSQNELITADKESCPQRGSIEWLKGWKKKLTSKEIQFIYDQTHQLASILYTQDDW